MKLSIVIPAYNSEKFIIKTIESLARQTIKFFEVIVVDDGSIDDTYNVAKNILGNSGIKKYEIIKKENGGVSSARNAGIDASSGDYIMFLDSDDYVSEKLVESIYAYLDKNKHDIISWGFNEVSEDNVYPPDYFTKYGKGAALTSGIDALRQIIVEKSMCIWTGSGAYKRSLLQSNGLKFVIGCNSGEDIEFIYKTLSKAENVLILDKILSYYVQRKGSLSKTYNIKKLDAIYAIERAAQYIERQSDEKFKQIVQTIRYDCKIKIYLNYVQSVFKENKQVDINNLLELIDDTFPELNQSMFDLMKNYVGKDKKLKIKSKLFWVSPNIYTCFFSFKNRSFPL